MNVRFPRDPPNWEWRTWEYCSKISSFCKAFTRWILFTIMKSSCWIASSLSIGYKFLSSIKKLISVQLVFRFWTSNVISGASDFVPFQTQRSVVERWCCCDPNKTTIIFRVQLTLTESPNYQDVGEWAVFQTEALKAVDISMSIFRLCGQPKGTGTTLPSEMILSSAIEVIPSSSWTVLFVFLLSQTTAVLCKTIWLLMCPARLLWYVPLAFVADANASVCVRW